MEVNKMNIRKMIKMLIVGLVIMGFTSTSMAFTGNSNGSIGIGRGGSGGFGGFGGWGTYEKEETVAEVEPATEPMEEDEETTPETAEEEKIVAEAEPETEPMEEEEYTDEEVI